MKLAWLLAWRNLMGAGLRTFLNVLVLSFAFVMILWMKGVMVGWDQQSKEDMRAWSIGAGQYWHPAYDAYDVLSLTDAHAVVPKEALRSGLVPVLATQASLFPQGRMMPVRLNGIPSQQSLLKLPTAALDTTMDAIPALMGTSMASKVHLNRGDRVLVQWRDRNGTFDAMEIELVDVFQTTVPAVDAGQVWIDLSVLQELMMLPNEATWLTMGEATVDSERMAPFVWKPFSELTRDIDAMIETKSSGQAVFYVVLLLLAMLAIFDTQVLSIFRRQKEIGTYVALGYTRREVVWLFTVEGSMHAVLAALLAAVYGIPLLWWQSVVGFTIPMDTEGFGMAIAPTLYPVYSLGLVVTTFVLVLITTGLVSYWPSRRIAKMNPTDALRGKIQ